MRSSPDSARVLLPTFEEMMGYSLQSFVEEDAALPPEEPQPMAEDMPPEEEAAEPAKSPAEEEMERVEKLCEGMRREAIAQSQDILRQAREEAVAIEHKALIHGRETAARELEAERQKAREAAAAAAAALEQARVELCGALEPYFLDTAINIAESILNYELERNSEAYVSIVRSMVERTFMAHNVVLHLPRDKYDELTGREDGEFLREMERHGARVESDPTLDSGECMVTSDMGSILGGAKTQLARIKYSLAGQGAQ